MSTDTILDRLKVCNAEITGVVRVDRLMPTKPIVAPDFPAMYAEPLGMTQPVPETSAGQYIVTRRFRLTLLVAQTALVSLDASEEGSYLLTQIMPYLDRITDYYMRNPQLSTDAGSGANGLTLQRDVTIQDNGPSVGVGPGGVNYGRIVNIMTVAERRTPSRQRLGS